MVQKKLRHQLFRSKKRVVRNGLVAVNAALIIAVGGFVLSSRSPQTQQSGPVLNTKLASAVADPLDTVSSADIAVQIAQLARMEEAVAVANNADTVNSQLETVPTDSQVVTKPQIVETALKSKDDVQVYVAVEGDTVASIAERFGVTTDTVRWSNNITGATVNAGTELKIPPVNGLIYTVKSGDTVDSITSKYSANKDQLIAFNDAELAGIAEGDEIVIPDGKVPVTVRYSAPTYSGFRYGSAAVYGYNGYDYGYCTWYVANKRTDIGRPIPANLGNASTWKVLAQRAGVSTGNTPQAGAVIWTPPRDYYGHVGYVEQVLDDGSVWVSEMNTRGFTTMDLNGDRGGGWGRVSYRLLSPEQAANYSYIY